MPQRRLHCLGFAGGLWAAGLACNNAPTHAPFVTGVQKVGEEQSNPLAAVQQLAAAGEALAQDSKELSQRTPTEPMNFQTRLPATEEREAQQPEGRTTRLDEGTIGKTSRVGPKRVAALAKR